MNKTEIIEIILWMRLLTLLINCIAFACVISGRSADTGWMSVLEFFVIYPKCFYTLLDKVPFQESPGFEMSQHSKMLSNGWEVYFFFK